MKRNIKTYFKFFVFLLGISLLLVNCERDYIENTEETSEIFDDGIIQDGIQIHTITLKQLKEKQGLQKTLEELSKSFDVNKPKGSTTSKVDANDGSFSILTNEIIEVITDSTEAYTFRIETPTDNTSTFENFVIDKTNDSLIKFYIYKYVYDETLVEDFKYAIDYIEVDEDIVDITNFDDFLSKVDGEPNCLTVSICVQACPYGYCHSADLCISTGASFTSVTNCDDGGSIDLPNGDGDDTTPGGDTTAGGDTPVGYVPPANSNDPSSTGILINEGALYLPLLLDLTVDEISWLEHHTTASNQIYDYITANGNSPETISFGELAIETMMLNLTEEEEFNQLLTELNILFPFPTTLTTITDYKAEILRMTTHLRQFGNPEDHIFADSIENLLPDMDTMTYGEVTDLAYLTYQQTQMLTIKYLQGITISFAEMFYPFIIYAVVDATLGAAIPILARIPLSMLTRGARLEAIILQTTKLGIEDGAFVRLINNSSAAKAKNLFTTLTKDAVTPPVTNAAGTITANMGGGNYITYRIVAGTQSPGVVATIQYNFVELLGTNAYKLKFYP